MPEENDWDDPENTQNDATSDGTGDGDKPTYEELLVMYEKSESARKKANNESAERRRKLKEFEEAEQKRKEKEMGEVEKLQSKISEMEKKNKELLTNLTTSRFKSAIRKTATELRFRNTDDAEAFLNIGDFEQNDDGQFEGIDTALKQLVKERPYLIDKTPPVDTDGTKRGTTNQNQDAKARKNSAAQRYGIQSEIK